MAIASTKKQNRILTVTLLVLLSAVAVLLIVTGQANKKETVPGMETNASETLREDTAARPAKNAEEKTAPKTDTDKAAETKPGFLGKDEAKAAETKEREKTEEKKKDADVTVDKFIMSMEVLGYNDVDAITVPQEVLDTAVDVTEEAG